MHTLALLAAVVLPAVDDPTPFDWSSVATSITTAMAGMQGSITTVLVAGLTFAAIFWGIPKLVTFFKKTAK